MPLLENDAILIGPEGSRFWLAGLVDQLAHWLEPNRFRGEDDLRGTLARVSTDDPVILLAHERTSMPERVALTLAGHTHGGQIRLPLVPPVWAPSEYGARLRPHRRAGPPHDRLGRAGLLQGAAAAGRAAGNPAHRNHLMVFPRSLASARAPE
jgi:predicted MPP superfamily phosphohydrolase